MKKNNDFDIFIKSSSFNKLYLPVLENNNRYLHLYGGAGSGKSYFAAQKIIIRTLEERKHRILLIRKVARTIRMSQFSLLKSLIQSSGLKDLYTFRDTDLFISNKFTSSEFIAAGMDDSEKLKSIHGVTSAWIEEATEIEHKDFMQLDLRLRGNTKYYKQIILTYNPVNSHHWLNTTNFKDSFKLQSTYQDNAFIDDDYKTILHSLKEQDENFYKVYALGEWGTLKNIIYKPFQIPIEYPRYFDETIYGLDFGFNNETALIMIQIKDNEYYLKELIFKKGLTNQDLINKMKTLNIGSESCIYCDSAEPDRIQEIKKSGFNVYQADKNISAGIDYIKRCKIFTCRDNCNINRENLTYSYKQDKDGNVLEEPVKFNDHAMDAIRYAIYTHSKNGCKVNFRLL